MSDNSAAADEVISPSGAQQSVDGSLSSPVNPDGANKTGGTPYLNPRSCVTCRRRKVRCDKRNPCNHCVKASIDCIFPAPGRAPRRPRKPQDTELLSRLRRLEGVVQSLGAHVDDDGGTSQTDKKEETPPTMASPSVRDPYDLDPKRLVQKTMDKEFGRLVIDEGRSRYVSNSFWASLGDEVAEMRDILDDSPSEDEEYPSPDQSGSGSSGSNHAGFVFGHSSLQVSLRALHPSPSQIFILWEVFKENVDPVVKIFHRPSLRQMLLHATTNIDSLTKVQEAVFFSLYLASVTSLTSPQCKSLLGEDKDHLIQKYRYAVEQSQARAGFLNSSSLLLLQSLVLFLICVRRHDSTRFVWTMSGIALRNAMALGVHRDGTNFGLSPYETEIRRRLWWHICILDNRAAEDHGSDPLIIDSTHDTQLPLNINDEDIGPDMKEPPMEKLGCTEMTFCLIRFEVSVTTRRLNYVPPGVGICAERAATRSLEEKERLIDTLHKRLEERYLRHCDMNVPIYWVTSTVARLIMAKMWLVVHHPLKREDRGRDMSSETRDRLFLTSTEVVEFSRLLESNENTAKWGWLFHTYMQWHAVAYLLSELIVRPPGPGVDRAWRAVDSIYDGWTSSHSSQRKGMLWRPMRMLMTKAMAVRQQQQEEANSAQWQASADQPNGNNGAEISGTDPISASAPSTQNIFGGPLRNDAISSVAMAFGMNLDAELIYNAASSNSFGMNPISADAPQQITPAQRNLSDEEINSWLSTDQMAQHGADISAAGADGWQGWDQMATDLQMGGTGEQALGLTDWF